MKTLTVQCSRKQPIKGVQFSALEASGSATLEFDEMKRKDEDVLEELERNLYDSLFHSLKVAEEAAFSDVYEEFEDLKSKYELVVNFIKDKKLVDDFKDYKKQR